MPRTTKFKRCPICGQPAGRTFRPFCSRRCSEVDLGRWLGGGYFIAGPPVPEESATAEGGDEGGPRHDQTSRRDDDDQP